MQKVRWKISSPRRVSARAMIKPTRAAKLFEREHEMSLVYNARDMVLQTERAIDRIDTKTYGRCEECGSAIGKARLQVFPRATLCMACKQKEERR